MPKSLLDPAFVYTPSTRSDIRLRFWRIQKAIEDGIIEYASWTFPSRKSPSETVIDIGKERKLHERTR